MVADYPIIMRCTSDAANEATGGDGHTGRWVKIVTTVAPPSAGYHHTQPISNIAAPANVGTPSHQRKVREAY